ncbi:uncharacterized protein CIMG_13627 [Coccidioides immitis RS]|uniref:CCHC-type domain-containing protein n=5 Tax=Coccidioides TaxID=5500 RepID=J3K6M4_COCIM|nr:uncharacterized protein CIMG_13627 [Coccidioides immitis RS]XP_003067484.1 zinc knuckle containing protein [Coccidioides posadasii C735 delta SOWgp]EFW19791.1 conserved hypothetical protein [Coccidioides posadasii str. Silveira]KMP02553.1 hypothetical protein CIRG_10362 [Coccidioides immitis RMSCC 2394]KMU92530.1 hypothetical protein CIHG_10274 [Coccidioides immitis H538.4]EAS30246.3 hypothetical protein CIMG_13627 [Coccidioides immitis RS]EER25339.1 zinc knuckle containing protein [Coccid|eukprot:XP_003067484.1 zinc knuckle containing protein [Coccidioides posadasii C735 delta SOWgp]
MVSTQRSQPPETREPSTPAENQPEQPPTLVREETTNPDTSALSTVDETETNSATSERESTLTSKDEIQQLREKTKLLKKMVKWQAKLNDTLQTSQKHLRSESLDIATSNPTPAKRSSVLSPLQHTKLYQTGTYKEYRRFTSNIESIRDASGLNNEETLAYALIGLDYIESELWGVYREQNPLKNNWNGLKEFLHMRLGDPTNRTRKSWRALFSLRKSPDETDYAYHRRFLERTLEIGEEFEDLAKLKKNLFIWSLDKPMRTKLDEQLEIPDDIDDIVALATRLRPSVSVAYAKNAPHAKPTNPVGSARRGMKTNDSRLPMDKRSQPQRPVREMGKDLIKDREALRKDGKCFECRQKGHLARDCPKKKAWLDVRNIKTT